MRSRPHWDKERIDREYGYATKWRNNNPEKAMIARCRARAHRKGIVFDLTSDDLFIPKVCPVLGIELYTGDQDTAPSLDRIDPDRGYVAGNVIVISNRANRIKNNATPVELMAIAKFFERLKS